MVHNVFFWFFNIQLPIYVHTGFVLPANTNGRFLSRSASLGSCVLMLQYTRTCVRYLGKSANWTQSMFVCTRQDEFMLFVHQPTDQLPDGLPGVFEESGNRWGIRYKAKTKVCWERVGMREYIESSVLAVYTYDDLVCCFLFAALIMAIYAMCLCSIASKEKWNAVMVARSRFAVHRFKSTRSFTSTHGSILRDHSINKSSFFTSALCLQLSPKCASKDQTFTSVAAWIAVGCFFSRIVYRLLASLIRDWVNRAVLFLWLISLDVCFACSLITEVGLLLFMSCRHCMDHLAKHTNIYVPTRMHVSLLECWGAF